MRLSELVETSRVVAATRSRREKIARLTERLAGLRGREAEIGVYFLTGRLRQGRIGLGAAMLREVAGVEPAARGSLTLSDVDAAFSEIAAMRGAGSNARRRDRLAGLFGRASADEQDFLARLVLGEIRQGALEGILTEAVSAAADVPDGRLRRAVMVAGDLAAVTAAALREGASALERFRLRPLEPVRPMLAQTAEDVARAVAALGEAAVEYKLDGARVQVHKAGDEVRVFSRRLRDVTGAVPEIVEAVRRARARELILDGEAIALRESGHPQPFQVTMRRFGRQQDVDRMRRELPLDVFFFDCLYADGAELIDRPGRERFAALRERLPGGLLIPRIETGSAEAAGELLREALAAGHEGVMAKSLEAPYEAGNRGSAWLKLKPAHTLDLVVLAAERGHGRRRGWLSNLHLGARDTDHGGFAMLGKTFKGLTDAMLTWQTEYLRAIAVEDDGQVVRVRPELVVEIAFDGVQTSPHYPAGLALRFARVKGYRTDKTPAEADTLATVRAIHAREETG